MVIFFKFSEPLRICQANLAFLGSLFLHWAATTLKGFAAISKRIYSVLHFIIISSQICRFQDSIFQYTCRMSSSWCAIFYSLKSSTNKIILLCQIFIYGLFGSLQICNWFIVFNFCRIEAPHSQIKDAGQGCPVSPRAKLNFLIYQTHAIITCS